MKTHMDPRRSNRSTGQQDTREPSVRCANATRRLLMGLALALAVIVPQRTLAASPAAVDLGSASPFAILAGSAITSTGGGTVNGNVGLSPATGGGITGLTAGQVNGTIYDVDGAGPVGSVMDTDRLTAAKADLTAAYNAAAGRPVDATVGTELGGTTVWAGVYNSAAGTFGITGTLTLDAAGDPDAVFIFKMLSTLTTAASSAVTLINGAQAHNVFWQVGSSATLGTSSLFKGTILANQSITLDTGSTMVGRALAINAAVTFDGAATGMPMIPTLARLVAFGADHRGGKVWVRWQTVDEYGTIGFMLERDDNAGGWDPAHPLLIPAQLDPSLDGVYEVADEVAKLGGTYTYQLTEVENDGTHHTYGPYTVTPAFSGPQVDNGSGASNVLSISAVLTGTLTSDEGLPTQVRAYWGMTDGETTFANWGHTNDLGTNAVGPLSSGVTSLSPNQIYYYRFYATNGNGDAWANATTNFQTLASAGPAPLNLRSTAHFTILAGAEITTTGGGIINGDIGASPISGSAIGIPPSQVNGIIYAVDATGTQAPNVVIDPNLLTTAKGDLTTAYNEAAGRTPVPTGTFLNPQGGNLGGLNLVPGLYKFTATALITGADVTLTGGPDDVWIFQIASDLQLGSGIKVILAGGAQARNIFWQVGTSAVLGTDSVFKGTILADQAITMNTGSVTEGRALAFSAGVTYNGTGGSLPTAKAPTFTDISMTTNDSVTVVINTTPYYLLTLESCTNLLLGNWTTVATNTPAISPCTLTDNTATTGVMRCFYRAFLPGQ